MQAGPEYRLVSGIGMHVDVAEIDGGGEAWAEACRT